jgi:CRISPR-associated protein Cas1
MSYIDNKTTLFILTKEAGLSAKRSCFLVEKEGGSKSIPLSKVLDIVVHNSVNIRPSAISLASQNHIPIHYVNNRGDYYGSFHTGTSANIFLRKAQYEKRMDKVFCLKTAQSIVTGKIKNQEWVLKSIDKNLSLPEIKERASLESLLGEEGKSSAIYWDKFPSLIKNPDFSFKKRAKHPATDEINALLSFGYVMLANRITSILFYIGLDPYFGFYHQDFYKRPALALDLMEEWRPIAVDKFVLNLSNRKEVRKEDFIKEGAAVYLVPKVRIEFVKKWYEWWTLKTFAAKAYKGNFTLSKLCELQCRKFSKVLTEEIAEYKPFHF